jgi:hypothetical protein
VNGKPATGNWKCMYGYDHAGYYGIDAGEGDDVTVFGEKLAVAELARMGRYNRLRNINRDIAKGKAGVLLEE